MDATLGYIIIGAWLVGTAIGLTADIHPLRDRPLGYVLASLAIEVAAVWLAIRAVIG